MVLSTEWISESFSKRKVMLFCYCPVQVKYTLTVAIGTGFSGMVRLNSTINLREEAGT